jgi:transposase
MEDRQPRNRRQFTAEFKRDAVELVRSSGRPIAEVARELGIYDSTLGNWVRQDRIDRGEQDGLSSDEQTRLRELERENARLRMERDLLSRKYPGPAASSHVGRVVGRPGQAASAGSRVTLWPSCSS